MPKMGDAVEEGDPIAEIETDKAQMEIEAENSGTLHEFIAEEGQDVPVGEAIAVILGEGEEPPESDGGAEAEDAEATEEESASGGHVESEESEADEVSEDGGEAQAATEDGSSGSTISPPS